MESQISCEYEKIHASMEAFVCEYGQENSMRVCIAVFVRIWLFMRSCEFRNQASLEAVCEYGLKKHASMDFFPCEYAISCSCEYGEYCMRVSESTSCEYGLLYSMRV